MYKGGSNYTKSLARLIRYAGLLVPFVMIVYGLLIKLGYISSLREFNDIGFLMIAFWWTYLSVTQFLFPSKTKRESALRLISYHLLAMTYLVFITGVGTPLIIFWIILMIATNTYFSKNGVNMSILWLIVTVAIDVAFWHNNSVDIITFDLLSLVAIILSGLILIETTKTKTNTKNKLHAIQDKENYRHDQILTIINNISDGIISTDRDGDIKIYNAACLNLLDTNNSLSGKNIDDVLKLTDQEKNPVKMFELLKSSKNTLIRDDVDFNFSDDDKIRLEITYSPIRSSYSRSKHAEKHDGYILIMRDITKAKSLEEERDEFISVVSHELRTPITIAEGTISNVQVLLQHPDVTPKMITDGVNLAHDQTIYLAKMVNDLSTLSRAERGIADNSEEIDIREMIHKMHEEYSAEASDKGIHLNLDLGATLGHVQASRLYLEELLQNFITNAIKYTDSGSVTISVKQKLGVVKFSVKDTGIGISRSDQSKIFQKFYRSEDYRTRESSGTGLGLYVASKLAHKLGTKIDFVSRLNHGSTFSISLPIVKK